MLEMYVIYLCVGFGHFYLVFIAIDFNNGDLFIYEYLYDSSFIYEEQLQAYLFR